MRPPHGIGRLSFWTMTPEAMALLHARAFAGQGRAWSVQEFKELLINPHVYTVSQAHGFALGRVIADEAELLSLATDPKHQRQGIGRAILHAYETQARALGAVSSFLEVARDNAAAVALYRSAGYDQTACRTGYYHRPDGQKIDALILSKSLG